MAQLCSFAVLCIRHAAPDQAAYNHEVLWSGSGTRHLPHCLPGGELPPTGPHLCHEHLLQVCCHHFPRSNRSWSCAAISALLWPNVADHLHWMSTLVHCSSCTHALSFKHALQPTTCGPPASACTAFSGQARQRVCQRPSLLHMLASLFASDPTVSTPAPWVMPCPIPTRSSFPCRASKRLLLLDYDGTLVDQTAIDNKPNAEVLKMVQGLCADPNNFVFIISGRARTELSHWFDPCVSLQRSAHAAQMLACQNLECVGVIHWLARHAVC